MFWAAPKFKNPPASKLATVLDLYPGIIITQTCAISKLFCIQSVHFVYNIVTVHGRHFLEPKVPYDNVVVAGICRI